MSAKTETKKISISQQIRDRIKEKLDSGIEIKDKNAVDELRKSVIDELQIKKNWRSDVKKFIGDELKDRGLSLADKGFKVESIDGMTVNVDGPEPQAAPAQPTPEPQPEPQAAPAPSSSAFPTPQPQSPYGTLPAAEPQADPTQPQQPVLTPQQMEMQEKFFKKIFGFAGDIYISLGLVETDDEEEQKELEKPKPIKEFRNDMNELAVELNQLMITYGMRLPKYLDMGMFALSVVMVMGMPIIKRIGFGEKKPEPKYDDDLEVDVKV